MKRIAVVLAVAMTAVALAVTPVYVKNKAGTTTNPGQLHTERAAWEVMGATASAGDEPNDLAVGERTYTTVAAAAEGGDSKIITFDLRTKERQGWNRMRFRCIGITNNQQIVYQIYTGTLGVGGTDCELANAGQLAFTIGQQASTTSTYEMADTVTVTPYCTLFDWEDSSPAGDMVADAYLDLGGADYIVAVPTTVPCNAKLLVKGL